MTFLSFTFPSPPSGYRAISELLYIFLTLRLSGVGSHAPSIIALPLDGLSLYEQTPQQLDKVVKIGCYPENSVLRRIVKG